MRWALVLGVLLGLVLSVCSDAATGAGNPGRPDAGRVTLGVDVWSTSGESGFSVSGEDLLDEGVGRFESRLRFPLDADYTVFSVSYGLPWKRVPLGARLQMARDDRVTGISEDYDWLHDIAPTLVSLSHSDAVGDSDIMAADVGWWFSWGGQHPEQGVELFAGYFEHEAGYILHNLRQIVDPYGLFESDAPLPEEVARWNVTFSGARLGGRTTASLGKGFGISGEVAFLLGKARAEGNWLLRELVFNQRSHGNGVDARAAVQYSPVKPVIFEVGWRYYKCNASEDGREDLFGPDSVLLDVDTVDEITADQKGWFAGVLVRF